MPEFALALFAVAVVGIPIFILLKNDYGKKRGCAGGCAAFGNREICHGTKKEQQKENKEEQH